MTTNRRWWVLLAWVIPFALASFWLRPRDVYSGAVDADAMTVSVPAAPTIGPWTGTDVPVSPRTLELLGADRVLNRTYSSQAGHVHLCVVESRKRRSSIHPPEVCYRGWGYEVQRSGRTTVTPASSSPFEANVLRLNKPDRRLAVLFWYRSGDRRTTSYLEQQLRLVLRLPFGNSGGGDGVALVRLSTEILPDEPDADERAMARLLDFAVRLADSDGSSS